MVSLILSLDQSMTRTGFAVLDYKTEDSYAWGGKGVLTSPYMDIARLADYRSKIRDLISVYRPIILTRELHNFALSGNANQLHELNGMIDLIAWDAGYVKDGKYYTIPPGFWKKYCGFKGTLAKNTGYLMAINHFLKRQKIDNYTEVIDDNEIDSMCMAFTALGIYRHYLGANPASFNKAQLGELKKVDQVRPYDTSKA